LVHGSGSGSFNREDQPLKLPPGIRRMLTAALRVLIRVEVGAGNTGRKKKQVYQHHHHHISGGIFF
jgi:hypothetical protein